MSQPLRIALLGFTRTERAALEAFFRLADKRTPAYEQVRELSRAHLVLLDTDDELEFARATELGIAKRCVAVGGRELPGAILQAPRPLNVLRLVSRLDRLCEPASPGARGGGTEAKPAARAPGGARVERADPAAPSQRAERGEHSGRTQGGVRADRPAQVTAGPASPRSPRPEPARPVRAPVRPAPTRAVDEFPPTMPAPLPATAAAAAAEDDLPEYAEVVDDLPPTMPMPLSAEMAPTEPMGLDEPRGAKPPTAPPYGEPALAMPLMPAHERISLVGLDEPARAAEVAAGETPRAAGSATSAARSGRPPRSRMRHVLVAGGSEDMLRWLVAELEPFGFTLHLVREPRAAMDGVRRHRCEFVLVDAGLGNHGAAALAAQLRLAAQDRGWAAPSVILFGERESLARALARGPQGSTEVEGALTLPLQRAPLLDLLGGRALRQQTFAPTAPQTADV